MAANMFLKLDGIDGESQQKGHEQWIEVGSFSWGVANLTSAAAGSGRGAGKPSFQDFSFTKQTDSASPKLYIRCATGEHIKSGQLSFLKLDDAGKGSAIEYLKIKLSDVLVSSFQESGGGDVPQDSFSLNFAKIEFSVMSQTTSWDLESLK